MRQKKDHLQNALTASNKRKLRAFVRQSQGIPQLAKARLQAISILWNLGDGPGPELGPAEVVELLKSSPLFAGACTPMQAKPVRKEPILLPDLVYAA
jgi:hypothetical protein